MKTKSALIPGFTDYDISPAITNTQPVQPAVATTIAPAPIAPRLTRKTAPSIFIPSPISASDDSDNDNDDVPVPPPTPHAPYDMDDTNDPLTPRLPRELRNLETCCNPKPGDKSNIALLAHGNDVNNDEILAYPFKTLM
jgi:hypothetical protein